MGGVVGWSLLNILWRVVEDQLAVCGGETVAVEDEGMEELATGYGHDHPRPDPAWLVLVVAPLF